MIKWFWLRNLLIIFCFIIGTGEINAQIVINEFSSGTSDNDWIEIFNSSDSEINIKNYVVKDTASSDILNFKSDYFMPAQAHCAFEIGNRLNNKGDVIRLFNNNEIDCVAYGDGNKDNCGGLVQIAKLEDGQFGTRQPDGEGNWTVSSNSTKGYSNNETIEPLNKINCYEATPKPSITPKPSVAPTPMPTKVEEEIEINNDSELDVSNQEINNEVLGLENEKPEEEQTIRKISQLQADDEEESVIDPENNKHQKSSLIAYGMITVGMGFVAIAGLPLLRKHWALYNKSHEETTNSMDPDNHMGKPHI